jgi:hypothetical protein
LKIQYNQSIIFKTLFLLILFLNVYFINLGENVVLALLQISIGGAMSYLKGLMFDESLLLGESKIILKAESTSKIMAIDSRVSNKIIVNADEMAMAVDNSLTKIPTLNPINPNNFSINNRINELNETILEGLKGRITMSVAEVENSEGS